MLHFIVHLLRFLFTPFTVLELFFSFSFLTLIPVTHSNYPKIDQKQPNITTGIICELKLLVHTSNLLILQTYSSQMKMPSATSHSILLVQCYLVTSQQFPSNEGSSILGWALCVFSFIYLNINLFILFIYLFINFTP